MKTFKSIPEFKNELEEFEFWSKVKAYNDNTQNYIP